MERSLSARLAGGSDLLVALTFLLVCSLPAPAAWADFARITPDDLEGGSPLGTSPAWADFNQDGFLDLVVNNGTPADPNHSHVFFSNGLPENLHFIDVSDTVAPDAFSRLSGWTSGLTGDLNRDGLPDFVRVGYDNASLSGFIEVYLNRGSSADPAYSLGDSTLRPSWVEVDDQETLAPSGAMLFDADRDGWLDVLVIDDGVRLYENPEDGTASLLESGPPGGLPAPGTATLRTGTLVDLDGDRVLDLVVQATGASDVWQGQPDGGFEAVSAGMDFTVADGGYLVCDYDNDGDLDILPFGEGSDETGNAYLPNQVFRNEGALQFTPDESSASTLTGVGDAVCGDIDNDGDIDLIYFGNPSEQLLLNEGGSPPGYRVDPIAGSTASQTGDLVDFDNDGDLDLVVARATTTEIWRNDTNDDNYLRARIFRDVSACDESPRYEVAYGARAILQDDAGSVLGMRHVSSGGRRGGFPSPVLHFGLPDGPGATYEVEIRWADPHQPPVQLHVIPAELGSLQELVYEQDLDLDDDAISNASELTDGRALNPPSDDVDEDGVVNWLDPDSDGDGVPDSYEAGDSDPCTPAADINDDGIPDYLQAAVTGLPTVEGGGFSCRVVAPGRAPRDAGAAAALLLLAGLAFWRARGASIHK